MGRSDRNGFTMVELLVVIAMLMILAGSITSSVGSASRRAKIQQATTELQEMTKAILAYENYGRVNEDSPLSSHLMEEKEATESNMGFILGQETLKNGQSGNIPVLFNAEIKNGAIRDPWGNPYRVTIRQAKIDPKEASSDKPESYVMFPNFNRLPAER
ncbi:MAG: type II secretion system protein [Kiritimatiellae bacterium]|nr:type II secretion system protein [Kiritimatiellia bacterium]